MKYNLFIKILLAFFSLSISLLIIEFLLRYYRIGDDERNLLYVHHPSFGWFPQPEMSRQFTGATRINIKHNSLGFRDKEFADNLGKKNLVFLGDSFAYGYDSEVHNRFSELVAKSLTNYDVFNLGISGYSTDQEFLLLKNYAHKFIPDVVYLLYHHNDWYGNSVNQIYNGYHKPYFTLDNKSEGLILSGLPIPKSINHLKYEYPTIYKSKIAIWLTNILYNNSIKEISVNPKITFNILLQMKDYVKNILCADFKIAVVGNGHTPDLKNFLKSNNFNSIYIDENNSEEFFTSTGHWTVLGNQRASEKILSHLISNN